VKANAALAWGGPSPGNAGPGDAVDPDGIPPLTLARWQAMNAVVADSDVGIPLTNSDEVLTVTDSVTVDDEGEPE